MPTQIHKRLLDLALHLENESGHLCWQLRVLLNLKALCTGGVFAFVYILTDWSASFLAKWWLVTCGMAFAYSVGYLVADMRHTGKAQGVWLSRKLVLEYVCVVFLALTAATMAAVRHDNSYFRWGVRLCYASFALFLLTGLLTVLVWKAAGAPGAHTADGIWGPRAPRGRLQLLRLVQALFGAWAIMAGAHNTRQRVRAHRRVRDGLE